MNKFYINEQEEEAFVRRLASGKDFTAAKRLDINDSLMSKRQVGTISSKIKELMKDGGKIYIPIQFNYKKLGDQKHRICLFISNGVIELFDSNSWNYDIADNTKKNLISILDATGATIVPYNFSLNVVDGFCVSFTLLFLLYKMSDVSVMDIFAGYETRNRQCFEKEIYGLLRSKNMDWKVYHKIIINRII